MGEKVIGKKTNVLGYFGALLVIVSVAVLGLFLAELLLSEGGFAERLLAREMLYLQLFFFGMLAPALAFCSYLTLGLKLSSRFFKLALRCAGVVLLLVFPLVSLLGFYTLWLSGADKKFSP